MEDGQALGELGRSLLRGGRPQLTAEQGEEAFDRHVLLAARVHRASRLNQAAGDREGQAWRRYFEQHFPRLRHLQADVLWADWRCALVKDDTPGPRVVLAHGSQRTHFTRDESGRLLVDLESMWDDFAESVDSFVASLERDRRRRTIVLRRYRERVWTVEPFQPDHHAGLSSNLADAALRAGAAATAVTATSIAGTPSTP